MEQLVTTHNKTLVSTIHKSKGKEFDHVILLLHKHQMNDDFLRLCYVGITRAKKSLTVITDNSFFKNAKFPFVLYANDTTHYQQPNQKTLVMGLADLYLSFNAEYQKQNLHLIAGSQVNYEQRYNQERYILIFNSLSVAQFSAKFQNRIRTYENQGYKIVHIVIEHIVEWHDETNNTYKELPLCKILMKR
ncbi:ATP-binding domain-containing protein [Sulfurimonas indica]|uniref:ATP-binding domain-containing protein n=1 Tax=Sulfurimonas indica TaxID=2508707 RepID=UPI001264F6C0|nr:ATP-binding domain-containing protein [Sulfurimonas indica]